MPTEITWTNIVWRIVEKVFSGQFVLTVLVGIAFLYAVIHKLISEEVAGVIMTAVFLSYFRKEKAGIVNGEQK